MVIRVERDRESSGEGGKEEKGRKEWGGRERREGEGQKQWEEVEVLAPGVPSLPLFCA